jgi:sporulation protein YlmC with PRC-barrel domain
MAIALLAALALANLSARAEESASDTKAMRGKHVRASKLIGKEVKNNQDERLGTINDLVLADNNQLKFAVLSVGGALGVGDSKVAVPISDLQCNGETIRLSATKDDLKNVARTPTGDWAFVAGEEWTGDIDGFYGHPTQTAAVTTVAPTAYTSTSTETPTANNYNYAYERAPSAVRDSQGNVVRDSQGFIVTSPGSRYEREAAGSYNLREPVRATKGSGAKELINHNNKEAAVYDEWYPAGTPTPPVTTSKSMDNNLQSSIHQTLRDDYGTTTAKAINVTVEDGIVTLRGTVSTEAEKQHIESRVKAMSGVYRVNNQLSVRD